MQLFEHQKTMSEEALDKLERFNSVLCQSATGSGKTVIFCHMISVISQRHPNDIILVSVHREELVQQTSITLAHFGIMNETITSKSNNQWGFSNVYVGMTQTVYARKTDLDVKWLFIDEAHEQIHNKTFVLFPKAKRCGFTATPIINEFTTYHKCNYCEEVKEEKTVCCYNENTEKWRKPVTLSESYESIVLGPSIKWLITNGFLVDEIVFSYNYYVDVKDIDDENEIAIESAKHDDQVLAEYMEKAEGKKTMIFTASTKQNISLVNTFKKEGLNIRSYDSIHNKSSERKDVVKWFRDTEGAILVSTGTFTTGFDVREVECIIINRPTKSLSLFHQIVGRGGRTSNLIFKESFIVIDLGGNTFRFGKWSDFTDWKNIFYNGLTKPKKKKETLIQCDKCAYNWIGIEGDSCPDCNHININQSTTSKRERQEHELAKMQNMTASETSIPMPNPVKIAEFVVRTTNEKKDFFRIIIDKYIDLWKLNRVSKKIYLQRIDNETLEPKIKAYIDRMYGKHGLVSFGAPRTKKYLISKIKAKLEYIYNH